VAEVASEITAMMGERAVRRESLVYGFNLDGHVPGDHLLQSIDRFVRPMSINVPEEPFSRCRDYPDELLQ
jgi:hypothetical protein